MLMREFGQTGETVSAIGFGGMRFANPKATDEMAEVVLRAVERGVTYLDTAPGYCGDQSEIIVGRAIREIQKTGKRVYTSTKTMRSDPSDIRAECERSLERLGVDAIDFYHVWCLVHPEQLPARIQAGALDEFRKLKEEGLVRHINVSTHLGHDAVSTMLDQGEGLFEGMLIGFNATNFPMRLDGIRDAASRGMGVVTMNTLGGGLMTDHADTFGFIMREGDESILDAALRFNLSVPEVTVALVGFRSVEDVDSALDAAERFEPLGDEEMAALKRKVLASSKDLCTQCGYCRGCPQEIPVMRLMEAYNHHLLDPASSHAIADRLRWHWGIGDAAEVLEACTECRYCEEACTQHLPILERFEKMKQLQGKGA